MHPRSSQRGLGLIEVLIYLSLLAMMSTVLTLFASQMIRRNAHARVTAEVLSSARSAIDLVIQEVQHAEGIYTPTSTFDTSPGQLSLATKRNLPADENETYVDFYIDDNRLYRKREGQPAELITSENTRVTSATFTHLHQSSTAPAIQVTLAVEPASAGNQAIAETSVTLTTTATTRSY